MTLESSMDQQAIVVGNKNGSTRGWTVKARWVIVDSSKIHYKGLTMKFIIVASGSLEDYRKFKPLVEAADRIICCDGGARHLKAMDILPDLVMGDFDSMTPENRNHLGNNHVRSIVFPVEKDAGDTELAVEWAMENGATEITLIGTTGTRLDHTLGCIFLMKQIIDHGIFCRMIDDHNEIYMVKDTLELSGNPGDLLSIIPVTPQVTGVCLKGLKYPLDHADLQLGTTLGVSNQFIAHTARISLDNGLLIVTKSFD